MVEQELGTQFMIGGNQNHGIQKISTWTEAGGGTTGSQIGLRIIPTGQQIGNSNNIGLRVGGQETGVRSKDEAPIIPDAIDSHGEELHDFPGVVFIRTASKGEITFLIAAHVEIKPHGRRQGNSFENSAEITAIRQPGGRQAVVHQLVVVIRQDASVVLQRAGIIGPGKHHDLTEGKSQSLTKLVLSRNGIFPPRVGEES